MSRDIRFAILGTGHMAQTFAIALEGVDGVALAGFCSRDAERARTFSTYFGAPAHYAGLPDILADPAVDALYIANDSAAHARAAIAAIEAGKAVLCEKPCGISHAEASAVAAAARQHGVLFMEAIPTPFLPAVAHALEAARNGRLGELRRFSAEFGYPASARSHPACFAPAGGGVLLDRMIYLVTLALLAMGPAAEVDARINRNEDGIDVEAWLTLTHAHGAVSTLAASLLSQLDNHMSISGTAGVARVEPPLLAAEQVSVTAHGAPMRAAPVRDGPGARLKRMAIVRRGLALARAARIPRLPYGSSLYSAEIVHFRDLWHAGAQESPVLPLSLTLSVQKILDRARAAAA